MKILILGLNYAPEKVGIAVYTTGLAEALAAQGHEVTVVAGRPYYPGWAIMAGHNAFTYGRTRENGVRVIRVPHYIPREPSGFRRLLHHASFAATSLPPMIGKAVTFRPDVVLTVAPSLIAAPVARLAAWLSGARSWLHVQDFEVEAGFATGLFRDKTLFGRLARWFEGKMLKAFDRTSSISPQMCRKLAEKGVGPDRIVEFRNWAEIERITPLAGPSPYRDAWGISARHVALYSGNIANKQGIDIVIEAAHLLRHRRDLAFFICGEGPNRRALEQAAADLDNVRFHDLQPAERLGDLLGLASVHLLPQLAGAADLVLPSKMANMLASGRPIVATAAAGTGLALEVEGCGLITPPGDAASFAAAIERLIDDAALSARLGQAGRRRALERWSRQKLIADMAAELERLAGEGREGAKAQGKDKARSGPSTALDPRPAVLSGHDGQVSRPERP